MNIEQISTTLNNGGIVILRTDTVYGILAKADNQVAVERIYSLKGRQSHKPFIILIPDASQAYDNVDLLQKYSAQYSDRPTSVIVESPSAPAYLKRDGSNLAYRIENSGWLSDILHKTGPLVAPSANPEGDPTAKNIDEAKAYFGDTIDLYIDGGQVPDDIVPSRIIRVNQDGTTDQLR